MAKATRRISLADLSIGRPIPWDVYDLHGRLLLRRGHVVDSRNQIEGMMERGLFVEIDPAWDRVEAIPAPGKEPPSVAVLIMDARRRLQGACAAAGARAEEQDDAPDHAQDDFAHQIMHVRQLVGEACRRRPDIALATILLNHEGRYSIRHAVDAALTCEIVGQEVGLNQAQLTATVAAALTMNISMLLLQDALQTHSQELTPEQRRAIQLHPHQGVDLLRKLGVDDPVWIATVQAHHEAIDGSGYPLHRKADEIPLPARLVSLADIYCARVSAREYRAPLRPNEALRRIFRSQGATVDATLAAQFIKSLGIFPPGTPVRLVNGEIAVVTQPGLKATMPYVASLIGPQGVPLAMPIRRDTSRAKYAVLEAANWAELGAVVTMQAIWGKDAALT